LAQSARLPSFDAGHATDPEREEDHPMRRLLMASAVLTACAGLGSGPAAARDYPWCLQTYDRGGEFRQCYYDTYRQCQDSASGRFAMCERNYAFRSEPQRRPVKGKRATGCELDGPFDPACAPDGRRMR
jgi:hypothetical protein